MSFQRMLEMARRYGMPLVVTDPNGKEPMVVLPLEVYEALVEGAPEKREPSRLFKLESEPEVLAELSVEERFYIEPLDESKNS